MTTKKPTKTKAPTAKAVAPGHLTAEQQAAWSDARRRIKVPITAERSQQLEAYAIERCRWLEAERYLAEHGEILTLRNDKGEVRAVVEAPQMKIARAAQDRALKLAKALHL